MKILGMHHSKPDFAVPAGMCDCHIHLFGPPDRFPLAEKRNYTPPVVGLDQLAEHHRALSIERAVVVQASVQATNGFLLDALSKWPDRLRGVAVIDENFSEADLKSMDRAGVRGIRVNLQNSGIVDPLESARVIDPLAAKVAPLGWHVQLITSGAIIAALAEKIARWPGTFVLDHFGGMKPSNGIDHPHIRAVLELVRSGKVYVKLSGQHRATETGDKEDIAPLARALVAANPDRMLWATDWPHVHSTKNRNPNGPDPLFETDDGADLNRLARWIGDAAIMKKVLVDNPARLYGF